LIQKFSIVYSVLAYLLGNQATYIVFDNHNLRKETRWLSTKPFVLPLYSTGARRGLHIEVIWWPWRNPPICCLEKILYNPWKYCRTSASILLETNTTITDRGNDNGEPTPLGWPLLGCRTTAFPDNTVFTANTWHENTSPEKTIIRHY